jgi:hypothetical protein
MAVEQVQNIRQPRGSHHGGDDACFLKQRDDTPIDFTMNPWINT